MPTAPDKKNSKPSKPCIKAMAHLFFDRLNATIKISNKENITVGVKTDPLFLSVSIVYKLVLDKSREFCLLLLSKDIIKTLGKN